MFKVLIVDDEAWVVKSLYRVVDWNSHGFEVVGSASDGVEALARIEELAPDLVITDIRMPVMGGLELMQKARERWPLIQFIIISVYAEFEYARTAIDCGAAGYCLKPADEQEIAKILDKVKTQLEAQTAAGIDVFALLEETNNRKNILNYLSMMGIAWDDNGMKVVCGVLPGRVALQNNTSIYVVKKSEFPLLPKPLTGTSRGISAAVMDPIRLSEAVMEAQIAAKQYFLTGSHGIYEYSTRSRANLRSRITALAISAAEKNARQIHNELEALLIELQSGGYNMQHAYQTFIRLCDVLDMQQTSGQDYEVESYRELSQSFADVREMIRFLQDQFDKQILLPPDQSSALEIIKSITSYLDNHLSSDITLSDLSAQFHLNPSYLCRIFKRTCGKTLTGYMIDLRLQNACQLLRSTCLPVHQIAAMCGYVDYFYFARLFKRSLGITPTQYREGMPAKDKENREVEKTL